jgi:DNA-binding MarR family transcriptional regulator
MLDVLPLVMRVLSREMRDTKHHVTNAHMPILAILERAPRSQSELAEIMSVSGATMSNTLTALEARGWIVRERSSEDRRHVHAQLTEAGVHALHDSVGEMKQFLKTLLRRLDPEDKRRLREGLELLRAVFLAALSEPERIQNH